MINNEIIYGRAALANGEPWITPKSLELLKTIIKRDWFVFEWGAGGSTAFWSRNCNQVISIEQNESWVSRVSDMLKSFQCDDNVTVKHIQADKQSYADYANAILDYPDNYFDLIYVDGEAACRDLCITNSIAKLKPNGYLLVDNSNWIDKNLPQFDWQQSYIETGLQWVGQSEPFDWETTIFRKCA